MTTIDLLQRYPPHNDSIQQGITLDEAKAFNGKMPDLSKSNPDPSLYFDGKTKLLHDMLDRVVKDLADKQSEPASEWEGTLWRSPLQPRSRSPAYSEISDSFESPGRIEHCTNDLLSTPMSPTSAQFKGPDGWPLGIEVAMNDFHSGRLSTVVLQENELPNPLNLRKRKEQRINFGGNDDREGQKTAGRNSAPSEQEGDNHHQQESGGLKCLALQKQQSSVRFQKNGEKQDRLDSANFSPLASHQQSYPCPQQQNNCQYRQESVSLHPPELQPQIDEETDLEIVCIPTLSCRRYGDNQNSLGSASSELHPALAHCRVPIGLGLDNADLEFFTSQLYNKEHDGSHTQIDCTSLLHKDGPQTTLSQPPRNKATHEDAQQAGPHIIALSDALGDGEIDSWKSSGPLDDILEESEDPLTSTLTISQAQPQHLTPGSAKPHNLKKSSGAGEKHDGMLTLQKPQNESSTLSLCPQRVQVMTISPTSKTQFGSTKPSRHRHIDGKFSEPTLSAATMAELNNPIRAKGALSAAALAEMRKTAESQSHFLIGPDSPEDQSQADIHPLLRSKSFSRPSFQPSRKVNESPLKYVFEDDDSEGHETEEVENFATQIITMPHPFFQPEASDVENVTTQVAATRHPSSQLGKMTEATVPKHLCDDGGTGGNEAECEGTFTSQMSAFRSSNDTTLVCSLEDATSSSSFLPSVSSSKTSHLSTSGTGAPDPDARLSISFLPPTWPSTTGYYPNSAIASPATYNSWASTPHHGNFSITPSSAATVPTSTVPTPNTPYHSNLPTSRSITMTPSSSFGQSASNLPTSRGIPMTPCSSSGNFTGNRTHRRSVSVSSMFVRYHKARYPDLPTAAMTDSILFSKESAERHQATQSQIDPFTSTSDTATPFSFNLKAPSKEDLADTLTIGVDQFSTPTKRGRFSLHRRSLSTSGRSNLNEGMERALSTMIFNPRRSRSRSHKRSHSTSASIDTTTTAGGRGPGYRRSLSVATTTVEQKWEIAPPPTPLGLRDQYSMRYRPEPLIADDHYSPRKDALQGMKQGLKKVFGRK